MADDRERTAHRAALDHVLGLAVALPQSDTLVLRGSMLMCAWAGAAARHPGDLDFVVLPDLPVPIDQLDPYPYVPGFDVVQQWPEFADGAGRYEIWRDAEDEFRTRGVRAIVPPEGLSWDADSCSAESDAGCCHDLVEQVRRQPQASAGVLLDADRARIDDSWTYSYGGDGPGGIRMMIPWSAPESAGGEVQVDFAMDERLPEPPVWTAISRANEPEAPLLVQAASPQLSLAWKLLWLHTDSAAGEAPRSKDLYDAVVLAEDDRVGLSMRLLRKVLRGRAAAIGSECELDISPPTQAEWSTFVAANPGIRGTAHDWLNRLDIALASKRA